jgi:hypothetical protein
MHPLHDYIAGQLAEKVKARRIVVWYDPKAEFAAFAEELRGASCVDSAPVTVALDGREVRLAEFRGSMLELRAAVEPLVSGDHPNDVVLYVPGCEHDRHASLLMELEKAGTTWKPQLNQFAKNVLLRKYTLGVVDELLPADRNLTYKDLAQTAEGTEGSESPSVLKSLFRDARDGDALLAEWLVSDSHDPEIVSKGALPELVKLVDVRLGLEVPADAPIAKLRVLTARYVLAGEFRLDLSGSPPAALGGVPKPSSKNAEVALRAVAVRLRARFPEPYVALADRIESELGLRETAVSADALGAIDTFRFEERALLRHAGDQISAGRFDDTLALVAQHENSFWLGRDLGRKAQWEAIRRMAELGRLAGEVRAAVAKRNGDVAGWLDAYTSRPGWYRLDQAQRRLEAWVASLDEEPEERPLGLVRHAYEDVCRLMAEGFSKAVEKSGWSLGGALHQTRVFSEVVTQRPKPVAFFLVDAMRFEMGVELAERLPKVCEVIVRPAIVALPSITPVGMAALLPGASASFSVTEQGGRLGARIEETFLPDLTSRKKFAAARLPKLLDLGLDELLGLQRSKLAKKIDGLQVVVVRSQELDHAGEAGFSVQARQVMDTVIDNLARAIRRLAAAGIEQAVVSADHGHLFASDRDESMRIDPPGGETVELHRRCWIGRGGNTPAGCLRVSAAALGYASDLEFVFPKGCGVFRAGGDLAFHHGGASLQELVIPVLTVRTPVRETTRPAAGSVSVTGLPDAVTNRIFSVALHGDLLSAEQLVLPLLISEGRQVGRAGMAADAQLDRTTGCVQLMPNKPATVVFLLSDDQVTSLRIVIQDPTNGAELYRSPADIPVRLGM